MKSYVYIFVEMKKWLQCDPNTVEHPNITKFLEKKSFEIKDELKETFLEGVFDAHDFLKKLKNNDFDNVPPEIFKRQDIWSTYWKLINADLAHKKILKEGWKTYFESLAYHLHIKKDLVNISSNNSIFTADAYGGDKLILVTPKEHHVENYKKYQNDIQKYMSNFGVEINNLDLSNIIDLPKSSSPENISLRNRVGHFENWDSEIIQKQRINIEGNTLVQKIQSLRSEFYKFYNSSIYSHYKARQLGHSKETIKKHLIGI